MNNSTKTIVIISISMTLFLLSVIYFVSDSSPDFIKEDISNSDVVNLSEIPTKNLRTGCFKSAVKFQLSDVNNSEKSFWGQRIFIANNPNLDEVLVGVTNNLISRVEIWNKGTMLKAKELGFVGKMTWGEIQTIAVEFYDQNNLKYSGESKLSMRFYKSNGFLGDIGTIQVDLTKYGDLSGDKTIGVFAKSFDNQAAISPYFSDLKIWNNYNSFD